MLDLSEQVSTLKRLKEKTENESDLMFWAYALSDKIDKLAQSENSKEDPLILDIGNSAEVFFRKFLKSKA